MTTVEVIESTFTKEELAKIKRYLKTAIKGKVDYHTFSDEDVEIVTRCIEALIKLG